MPKKVNKNYITAPIPAQKNFYDALDIWSVDYFEKYFSNFIIDVMSDSEYVSFMT